MVLKTSLNICFRLWTVLKYIDNFSFPVTMASDVSVLLKEFKCRCQKKLILAIRIWYNFVICSSKIITYEGGLVKCIHKTVKVVLSWSTLPFGVFLIRLMSVCRFIFFLIWILIERIYFCFNLFFFQLEKDSAFCPPFQKIFSRLLEDVYFLQNISQSGWDP